MSYLTTTTVIDNQRHLRSLELPGLGGLKLGVGDSVTAALGLILLLLPAGTTVRGTESKLLFSQNQSCQLELARAGLRHAQLDSGRLPVISLERLSINTKLRSKVTQQSSMMGAMEPESC